MKSNNLSKLLYQSQYSTENGIKRDDEDEWLLIDLNRFIWIDIDAQISTDVEIKTSYFLIKNNK
jgi:hypothetical protein